MIESKEYVFGDFLKKHREPKKKIKGTQTKLDL